MNERTISPTGRVSGLRTTARMRARPGQLGARKMTILGTTPRHLAATTVISFRFERPEMGCDWLDFCGEELDALDWKGNPQEQLESFDRPEATEGIGRGEGG